jgi:hypothetical protein
LTQKAAVASVSTPAAPNALASILETKKDWGAVAMLVSLALRKPRRRAQVGISLVAAAVAAPKGEGCCQIPAEREEALQRVYTLPEVTALRALWARARSEAEASWVLPPQEPVLDDPSERLRQRACRR